MNAQAVMKCEGLAAMRCCKNFACASTQRQTASHASGSTLYGGGGVCGGSVQGSVFYRVHVRLVCVLLPDRRLPWHMCAPLSVTCSGVTALISGGITSATGTHCSASWWWLCGLVRNRWPVAVQGHRVCHKIMPAVSRECNMYSVQCIHVWPGFVQSV